ncbi:hypothetical protein N7520_003929 [Penicillium odoratum]|uniref:uncharacterized protein n=1 Tax=Penicillium odoratum TaxID=1167516 RepID=UPI002546A840|nr:uncharacterized protein N7520_003929 [Penicillium odoratum]KAJ5769370.1 hypothetical protein N7520_003929 [Penicillium odoratum]
MSASPSRRMAPPLYSSHSLEGMEQVVPPKMMYFTPHRSELLINKPLPGRPVPIMMLDSPTEYSAMYSDSDSDESTLDESLQSPSISSSYSRDNLPIFVRSNSDDFTNLNDRPAPERIPESSPLQPHPERTDSPSDSPVSIDIDATSIILGTSAHYGRPVDWTRTRIDSSHYFREKTWDFFPELATPSLTRPTTGRESPASRRTGKEGRLNVSAKQPKWYSMHSSTWKPAVRDSIKSYVNKTLARDNEEEKDTPNVRRNLPSRRFTAPMGPLSTHPPSIMGDDEDFDDEFDDEPEMDEFHAQLVATSTVSSSRTAAFEQPRSSPLTPKEKKRGMLKKLRRATSSPEYFAHATPPLSAPPVPKIGQQHKRQTLGALQTSFDDAKKRMTETPDDRRRELLKSQIKFVGAVNPHLCAPHPDPWSP